MQQGGINMANDMFYFLRDENVAKAVAERARNLRAERSLCYRERKGRTFSTPLRSRKKCKGSSLILEPSQNTIRLLVPKI